MTAWRSKVAASIRKAAVALRAPPATSGSTLKASAEGEAWVRDRIMKMNPIREGMEEADYLQKVDEFMSTSKTKELVRDVGEALRGKPVPVAAFRRVMTPGSSWRSTGLAPKKELGTRQVKTVRSNDIVFSKEDGSDTHLDLPDAEVRQLGDTFFVFWPDVMNVLKYEPAEFDSGAAEKAKEERARAQQEAEALREQKETAAKEAAQAAEAALWDGFLVGLPGLKKGQAKKSLDKLIRMNDRTAKTGDHIRDMVAQGYRVDGDRFWNKDRNSFFDKKVLGVLPFMYAVFLAGKVRSGSTQKPPWRCATCKGPVQHDQTDAVSFCPACKEYVNVERKPPKKVTAYDEAMGGKVKASGSLHDRIAKALKWSMKDVQSMSLASLRELVRPVDKKLADEISTVIQKGGHLFASKGVIDMKTWKMIREKANDALEKAGFDGNGRFKNVGQANNKLAEVLSKFGLQLADVMSADRFREDSRVQNFGLEFVNPQDSFSPIPFDDSMVHYSYTKLSPDRVEVVAYLS
jgi:ElaB/YqjD/DUF883 family membrane-anchored ribosome-binding protein/DNA-directed RNA polymerase subunit RPC12/RpoP